MRYPGGKGKTYQHIINLLPPHSTYVETHLGGGAVLRHKAPAGTTIGVDIDPAVVRFWRENYASKGTFIEADAGSFLKSASLGPDDLVYADPPYLPSTRLSPRVYRFEYGEEEHEELLSTLVNLRCRVLISGYPSTLYTKFLQGWNCKSFLAKAHNGLREERLWFNYSVPQALHDSRFLGEDFHERQNIKRRLSRLKKRISALTTQEQHVLLQWLRARMGAE